MDKKLTAYTILAELRSMDSHFDESGNKKKMQRITQWTLSDGMHPITFLIRRGFLAGQVQHAYTAADPSHNATSTIDISTKELRNMITKFETFLQVDRMLNEIAPNYVEISERGGE